jgi:hypothetical protein
MFSSMVRETADHGAREIPLFDPRVMDAYFQQSSISLAFPQWGRTLRVGLA